MTSFLPFTIISFSLFRQLGLVHIIFSVAHFYYKLTKRMHNISSFLDKQNLLNLQYAPRIYNHRYF